MKKQIAINELKLKINALNSVNFDPNFWLDTTNNLLKKIFVNTAPDKIESINELTFFDPYAKNPDSQQQYIEKNKAKATQYIEEFIREIEIHGLEKERASDIKIHTYWGIWSAIVAAAFSLGLYFGNANYDKEKTNLEYENHILKSENDSLRKVAKFYPPIDSVKACITSPKSNDSVNVEIQVKGTVQNFRSDIHLWLVINPRKSSGWWPQISEIIPQNGSWKGDIRFGGNAKEYDVHIVRANDNAHYAFVNYLEQGLINNDFPDKPLPDGAISLHSVTVLK